MAASDLSKPLGQDKSEASGLSRIFMFSSFGLLAMVVLGLTSWILLADNPDGGLPTSEVDLAAKVDPNTRIGVVGIRPSIKPGIPETTLPDEQQVSSPQLDASMPADIQDDAGIRVLDPADPSLNAVATADGAVPYQAFARPVNTDAIAGLPKIAIIMDGLGLSQTTTEEALTLLPPDITLAFAPYGNSLSRWTRKARSQGHELLVQVPMEPFDYPNNDPGPHTLLTSANAEANKANLNWVLERFDQYVGVINYMGARFSSDELAGSEFMTELKNKGLLYVENSAQGRSRLNIIASKMSIPNLRSDLVIDFRGRPEDIETRLVQLESIAQENGSALGVASAFPTSIRSISDWTQSLRQRGFALVPITTLLKQ
ncbi:divergent polysaccharide deacetylase family protein [uncultured Cohaesibacter sp.]|uniref:divergent polysaccharide deacetylase family protein n=1 Tax=uncultured Cohaesibacter sp. TaxID=1002546 RepID=UPI0029C6C4F7|nr:divergent polysaccharide deacetylase family protein [uncultured Cohaesibacter sp.]